MSTNEVKIGFGIWYSGRYWVGTAHTDPAIRYVFVHSVVVKYWNSLFLRTISLTCLARLFSQMNWAQCKHKNVITDLCLKSPYNILFGNPFLQIRMPSRTPLHLSWCRTSLWSIRPMTVQHRDILIFLALVNWSFCQFLLCVLEITWGLCFIGNDTTHKMRMSCSQVGHQLI